MKGYGMIKLEEPGWLEKPKPEIGPLDALLKPVAVAPCSSDTHILHGGIGPVENLVLGHEAVGEVVEVGEMVKKFKPGDRVVVATVTPNYEADNNLQEKGSNNAHEDHLMGSFKFVLAKDGLFSELFSVNNADTNLALIPEGVSTKAALMIDDMMSTGIYGAGNAEIKLGDSVVVFGIGPVGLMAVAGAKLLGAGRIYAIGTRPNCVELAKEYGATDIISYKEGDVVEQILALEGKQVDRVIIAGGNANSMNQALQLVRSNGNISNVNFFDSADEFNVPAPEWGLGMADVTIKGGMCPGGAYRVEKNVKLN